MDREKLDRVADLRAGDIVTNRGSGEAYVVTATYGDRAIAVRTVQVSHPSEWNVLRRVPVEGAQR